MKVAIDISPLSSGHKVRGVGFYLKHLKAAFEANSHDIDFQFFTRREELKSADLVHYPYFDPFFLSFPIKSSIPTVVTVHDLTPIKFSDHFPAGLKGRAKWEVNRRVLARVDGIITDSDSSTTDVLKYISISQSKVRTVHLAAGEEFRRLTLPQAEKKKLLEKYSLPEKFALYVGDVTWNKNLPRLVSAVMKNKIPLVLAGKAITEKNFDLSNPWNKDRVMLHQLLDNAQNIYPLGFVPDEDIVALYNLATLLCMPSLYEGFGLPVIEAMQCGTPVVTSQEGSLPEVAGEAARYVDAYSVDDIAKGIAEVFSSDKLQKDLSEKGLKQAEKFSWNKTAEETIAVYKNILKI